MSASSLKRSGRSARSPHTHPHLTERQQLAVALKESAASFPVSSSVEPPYGGPLRVWVVIVLYLIAGTALPVTVHTQWHGFNPIQAFLAFFLILNSLICLWEISLGLHITHIHDTFKSLQATYGSDRMRCVSDLFFTPVPFAQLLSGKFWSRIWATYSLYDPSYSNREAYGFIIDVGNGWSTIIPSLFFLLSMTTDSVYGVKLPGAQTVGVIGIIKFYQELYGTILYFLSFFFNGRQRGKPIAEVAGWVGGSNGLWIIFPLVGMYASFQMISTQTFDVVRASVVSQ